MTDVGTKEPLLGIELVPAGAGTGGGDGGRIGITTLLHVAGEGRGSVPSCPGVMGGKGKPAALMQVIVPSIQMSGAKQ